MRAFRRLQVAGLVSALVTGVGCGTSGLPGQAVPPVPPNTQPSDLYHDSVMVADDVGRWSKAVLAVAFDPALAVAERAAAIESVSGRVVGGIPLFDEGYYLVRVPHGDTLEDVDAAIAKLSEAPGVWSATRISAPRPIR